MRKARLLILWIRVNEIHDLNLTLDDKKDDIRRYSLRSHSRTSGSSLHGKHDTPTKAPANCVFVVNSSNSGLWEWSYCERWTQTSWLILISLMQQSLAPIRNKYDFGWWIYEISDEYVGMRDTYIYMGEEGKEGERKRDFITSNLIRVTSVISRCAHLSKNLEAYVWRLMNGITLKKKDLCIKKSS